MPELNLNITLPSKPLTSGQALEGKPPKLEAAKPQTALFESDRFDRDFALRNAPDMEAYRKMAARDLEEMLGLFGASGNRLEVSLKQSATVWNSTLSGINDKVDLNLQPQDGLLRINAEKIASLKLSTILEPESIPTRVWEGIPSRHFESQDLPDGGFDDFRQGQEPTYAVMLDRYRENMTGEMRFQRRLEEMEKTGKWFHDFYFKHNQSLQSTVHIKVEFTEKQIEKVKAQLSRQRERKRIAAEIFPQAAQFTQILRTGKTVRNIMSDPLYLDKKLIGPTLEALNKCQPGMEFLILEGMKAQLKALFGDIGNSSKEARQQLESNNNLGKEQKEKLEQVLRKIYRRVRRGLEVSLGSRISSGYSADNMPKPKLPLPSLDSGKKLPNEVRECLNNLQKALSASKDGGRLDRKKLASLIAHVQVKMEKFGINPEGVPKSSKDSEKQMAEHHQNQQKAPKKPQAIMGKEGFDPVFETTKTVASFMHEQESKQAKSPEVNSLSLPFAPFAQDRSAQGRLESLLGTNSYSDVFRGEEKFTSVDVEGRKVVIDWSPALCSRLNFMMQVDPVE